MRILLLTLILFGCATTKTVRDDRGIATLIRRSEFSSVTISPDGAHLALTAFDGAVSRLAFMRMVDLKILGAHALAPPLVINRVVWANNTRVAIELATQRGPLDLPVGTGEIMAVDLDGSDPKLIFSYRAREMQTGSHLRKQEAIYAFGTIMGPLDESRILVQSEAWSESGRDRGIGEVYAVNVHTGVRDKVVSGPGPVQAFLTDEKGEVKMAYGVHSDGTTTLFSREKGSGWEKLGSPVSQQPIGWSASTRTLYLIDQASRSVQAFSLESGESKVISQREGAFPRRVLFDPERGTPIAVEYEPDYPQWHIVDDSRPFVKQLAALKEKYPGLHARITSVTRNGSAAVALVYGDRNPGVYHLLAPGGPTPLFAVRDGIDEQAMSPMEAFRIKASDGLDLHGYLTLPVGKEKNLPMVVIPHGGPHDSYDEWGFNPMAQLFAKFGFAVLQINFRGSGGYGIVFEQAGYQRWGDRIQDDIIEATRWAIQEGVADAKRICIFGASFGGYSAVQSSIRAPDLFRCAVGYAGVYDLPLLFKKGDVRQTTWGRGVLSLYLGEDLAALEKMSPVRRADEIRVPILLVHGEEDERAPIAHAEALMEALKERQKPIETLFVEHEGHGFWDDANRLLAYHRILEFIEQHTK